MKRFTLTYINQIFLLSSYLDLLIKPICLLLTVLPLHVRQLASNLTPLSISSIDNPPNPNMI